MDCPNLIPVIAEVTAYAARCPHCQTTNITANGTNTDWRPYGLAADPSLPFGTTVIIPAGHGLLDNVRAFDREFVVDDRGGGVTREAREKGVLRIDLRVISDEYARKIGRRRLIVWVVR